MVETIEQVSLDYYRRESWKIYQLFKEGLPGGEVGEQWAVFPHSIDILSVPPEKASIDEAFIDFTKPVREEILRRYPYLAEVSPDAPDGKDSPLPPPPPPIMWNGLGTIIPIHPAPLPDPAEDNKADHSDKKGFGYRRRRQSDYLARRRTLYRSRAHG